MSEKWTSISNLPKKVVKFEHNARKFKSFEDSAKSTEKRQENARNSRQLSKGAKLIYLSGKARMCNAEKLLQSGFKL